MSKMKIGELEEKAKQIRRDCFEMIIEAGGGHIPSCMSIIEILVALYYEIMKPEDRFILSKGHAGFALYAILVDKGIISREEAVKLCPHPEISTPGIEFSSGSLGHGLSFGAGLAYAMRKRGQVGNVYVLLGDGECQEGQNEEAIKWITEQDLSNIYAIIDCNGWMALDRVEMHYKAEVFDGHDIGDIVGTFNNGDERFLIAKTIKGKGISYMIDNPVWHYKMPNEEEIEIARKELE